MLLIASGCCHNGMKHAQTKTLAVNNFQACGFDQIQRVLIPTAARVLLVVWENMPVLMSCEPGYAAMAVLKQEDESSRAANTLHFAQCLNRIGKGAGG